MLRIVSLLFALSLNFAQLPDLRYPVACNSISPESDDFKRLLTLSSLSTVHPTDMEAMEERLLEIRHIFQKAGDRRGIFTTIYTAVTRTAVEAVQNEEVKDLASTRRLTVEFAKTYLHGLHLNLTNPHTQNRRKWGLYYAQAQNCDTHPLKVMATGMNTHIVLDLSDAIVLSGLRSDYFRDYMHMGNRLVDSIPAVAVAMQQDWGIPVKETEGLVHSWWLGKGFNWTAKAIQNAFEAVSGGVSIAWEWLTDWLFPNPEIATMAEIASMRSFEEDPTGTLSMNGLRVFAWWQAQRQKPYSNPKETWTMRRMWDAVQVFFNVSGVFLESAEVSQAEPAR